MKPTEAGELVSTLRKMRKMPLTNPDFLNVMSIPLPHGTSRRRMLPGSPRQPSDRSLVHEHREIGRKFARIPCHPEREDELFRFRGSLRSTGIPDSEPLGEGEPKVRIKNRSGYPARTRTLNDWTKTSCVTITPRGKTFGEIASPLRGFKSRI